MYSYPSVSLQGDAAGVTSIQEPLVLSSAARVVIVLSVVRKHMPHAHKRQELRACRPVVTLPVTEGVNAP